MKELGFIRQNRINDWFSEFLEKDDFHISQDRLKRLKDEFRWFVQGEIISAKSANMLWLIKLLSSYKKNIENLGVEQIIDVLTRAASSLDIVSAESKE